VSPLAGTLGTVHPIEHLRFVARADHVPDAALAREAADALASFTWDRPGLVMACRRLVSRQPASAPLVWLAARVVAAVEPDRAIDEALAALAGDRSAHRLVDALPAEATVTLLDRAGEVVPALGRRGDLAVRVVATGDEADGVAWRLGDAGLQVVEVPARGLGAAAATSGAVVLEARGVGPDAVLAASGSLALAATAHQAGVPVWLLCGVGRVLPAEMWAPFARRALPDPTDLGGGLELVPLGLVDHVVGPGGPAAPAEAAAGTDCPVLPELFRGDVI
jgi:hypothetical protein